MVKLINHNQSKNDLTQQYTKFLDSEPTPVTYYTLDMENSTPNEPKFIEEEKNEMTKIYTGIHDEDDSSVYPTILRVNNIGPDIKKSKNNTRRERRYLRRLSKRFKVDIVEIKFHRLSIFKPARKWIYCIDSNGDTYSIHKDGIILLNYWRLYPQIIIKDKKPYSGIITVNESRD